MNPKPVNTHLGKIMTLCDHAFAKIPSNLWKKFRLLKMMKLQVFCVLVFHFYLSTPVQVRRRYSWLIHQTTQISRRLRLFGVLLTKNGRSTFPKIPNFPLIWLIIGKRMNVFLHISCVGQTSLYIERWGLQPENIGQKIGGIALRVQIFKKISWNGYSPKSVISVWSTKKLHKWNMFHKMWTLDPILKCFGAFYA